METIFAVLSIIGQFIEANSFLIGAVLSLSLSAVLALNGEKWMERLIEKYPSLIEEFDEPQTIFSLIRNKLVKN